MQARLQTSQDRRWFRIFRYARGLGDRAGAAH